MLGARMATEDELDTLSDTAEDEIFSAQIACTRLLERRPDIDAIICVSDTIATGARLALAAGSGDDGIAVSGFDDTATAESMGLNSIAQPLTESARELMRIIQERLDAGPDLQNGVDDCHVLLPPKIIIR